MHHDEEMPPKYLPSRYSNPRSRFEKEIFGSPESVVNYFFMVAEELREIMAKLGIAKITDMVGRVDLLDSKQALDHWKTKGLDFSNILKPAKLVYENTQVYMTEDQDQA